MMGKDLMSDKEFEELMKAYVTSRVPASIIGFAPREEANEELVDDDEAENDLR